MRRFIICSAYAKPPPQHTVIVGRLPASKLSEFDLLGPAGNMSALIGGIVPRINVEVHVIKHIDLCYDQHPHQTKNQ